MFRLVLPGIPVPGEVPGYMCTGSPVHLRPHNQMKHDGQPYWAMHPPAGYGKQYICEQKLKA